MQETRANQTESNVRSRQRDGGGRENQQVVENKQQQGGSVTRQESGGRESRVANRQGSRQLASTSQSPFAMMRQMSREMDRLMDSFFDRGFGSLLRDRGARDDDDWQSPTLWRPQIDVQQRKDAVVVRADLPGVRKEDIQIDVDNDALIISGQRSEEHEEGQEQGYRVFERSYGSFYRTVPLPQGTNPDEIKAEMRDGVLKVTLPLAENARPRRIQIQS